MEQSYMQLLGQLDSNDGEMILRRWQATSKRGTYKLEGFLLCKQDSLSLILNGLVGQD
jgi:hypothetical protein